MPTDWLPIMIFENGVRLSIVRPRAFPRRLGASACRLVVGRSSIFKTLSRQRVLITKRSWEWSL